MPNDPDDAQNDRGDSTWAYLPGSTRPPTRAGSTHTISEGDTARHPGQRPSQEAAPPVPAIPGYHVLGEIARGGMGVVYQARHLKLDRVVALKTMLHPDKLLRARFLAEGQVVAAIKHPHVVEVYDLGDSPGGPYIAMEYLTGGTFGGRLTGGSLPPRDAAAAIAAVATGVAAAHDLGVVHRDLKPGNVLLAADGTPKVTDFGLAKRAADDLTATGAVGGTPAYMAPEQARAMKFVGPPADVWSLGVMLYEALSCQRPFVADTDLEVMIRIQNDDPPALRTVIRGVPHALETICLKCLEKEPDRRYPTAKELAADLTAWYEGRPIAARRATPAERAVLWVRRKPTVAAAWALANVVVMLGGFALAATGLWREAVAERGIAEGLKAQAEESRDAATTQGAVADEARQRAERSERSANRAKAQVEETNAQLLNQTKVADEARRAAEATGTRLAAERVRADQERSAAEAARATAEDAKKQLAAQKVAAEKARDEAVAARQAAEAARTTAEEAKKQLAVQKMAAEKARDEAVAARASAAAARDELAATDYVRTVELAYREWRDGRSDRARILLASCPEGLRGWEWEHVKRHADAEERVLPAHPDEIAAVSAAAAGTHAVTAGKDGAAFLWDLATGTGKTLLGVGGGEATAVAISPDGKLALTSAGGKTSLRETQNGNIVHTLTAHTDRVVAAAFSPDGRWLVTGSADKSGRIWDVATGRPRQFALTHTSPLVAAAVSPDGEQVATASEKGGIGLWNPRTGTPKALPLLHSGPVRCLCYHPKSGALVSAGDDRTIRIWNPNAATETAHLETPGKVTAVGVSADGKWLIGGDADGTLRVWDADTLEARLAVRGHVGAIRGLAVLGNRFRVATVGADGTLRVWDIDQLLATDILAARSGGGAAFAVGDGQVAAVGWGNTVRVAALNHGGREAVLRGHTRPVTAVALAGGRVATGSRDGTVKLWDAQTGQELRTLPRHEGDVRAVGWSPAGDRVVSADSAGMVHVWDAETGKKLTSVPGHKGGTFAASFGPAGKHLLTAGADQAARVWDAETGAELLLLRGHGGRVLAAAFSPDGSRIATGSEDRTVRLWDAATGGLATKVERLAGPVTAVAFNRSGSRLGVTCGTPSAVVIDAATGKIAQTLSGQSEPLTGIQFGQTDQSIITAAWDRSVRVWASGDRPTRDIGPAPAAPAPSPPTSSPANPP
ncbi:protein kinase domain-containing protein [Limnoglobus roseus]|uniref:Serine/threonine protein kinase n=1 Tax=Limnoglobus roseus TaxID=2598579 RepID=A0A5C1ARP5_9BACT|nr:protein kinase [Limnoglobus roseus]QEL20763.1 serine/threonine protein kinase [Limnoglobus roseus]